eukprot:664502-Pelagomonas_calceolata.AAC.6
MVSPHTHSIKTPTVPIIPKQHAFPSSSLYPMHAYIHLVMRTPSSHTCRGLDTPPHHARGADMPNYAKSC